MINIMVVHLAWHFQSWTFPLIPAFKSIHCILAYIEAKWVAESEKVPSGVDLVLGGNQKHGDVQNDRYTFCVSFSMGDIPFQSLCFLFFFFLTAT